MTSEYTHINTHMHTASCLQRVAPSTIAFHSITYVNCLGFFWERGPHVTAAHWAVVCWELRPQRAVGARRIPPDSIPYCLRMGWLVRKLVYVFFDLSSDNAWFKSQFCDFSRMHPATKESLTYVLIWQTDLSIRTQIFFEPNLQKTLVGSFYHLLHKDLPQIVELHLTKTLVRSKLC